jgi:hypothetical protein
MVRVVLIVILCFISLGYSKEHSIEDIINLIATKQDSSGIEEIKEISWLKFKNNRVFIHDSNVHTIELFYSYPSSFQKDNYLNYIYQKLDEKFDELGTNNVQWKVNDTVSLSLDSTTFEKRVVLRIKDSRSVYVVEKNNEIEPSKKENLELVNRPKNTILKTIRSSGDELTYAYNMALKESRRLSGKLIFSWDIDGNGDVKNCTLDSSTMDNHEFEETITFFIERWNFGRIADSSNVTKMSYYFVFEKNQSPVKYTGEKKKTVDLCGRDFKSFQKSIVGLEKDLLDFYKGYFQFPSNELDSLNYSFVIGGTGDVLECNRNFSTVNDKYFEKVIKELILQWDFDVASDINEITEVVCPLSFRNRDGMPVIMNILKVLETIDFLTGPDYY